MDVEIDATGLPVVLVSSPSEFVSIELKQSVDGKWHVIESGRGAPSRQMFHDLETAMRCFGNLLEEYGSREVIR